MKRFFAYLFPILFFSSACESSEPPKPSPVTLFVKEFGSYSDTWSAVPAEGVDNHSATYLTVTRNGKSGDYLVNMVIDCRSGKHYFGAAIEYGHIVVPQDDSSASVPKEVPSRAVDIFCRK